MLVYNYSKILMQIILLLNFLLNITIKAGGCVIVVFKAIVILILVLVIAVMASKTIIKLLMRFMLLKGYKFNKGFCLAIEYTLVFMLSVFLGQKIVFYIFTYVFQ